MPSEIYQRIRANPKYQELTKRRSRVSWALAWFTICVFFGFVLIAAFSPGVLAAPISDTGVTTVAVVVGAILLILFWLLTAIYIRYSTRVYDKMNEEILREVVR